MTTIQFIRDTPEGRVYMATVVNLCELAGFAIQFSGEIINDYDEAMKGNYYVILK